MKLFATLMLLLAATVAQPRTPQSSRLAFFELTVKDLVRAKTFYSQLFGWSFADSPSPDFFTIKGAGVAGAILRDPDKKAGNGDIKVFFEVADVDRDLARAKALGAEVLLTATRISPTRTLAEFRDLDGNVIGMIHDVNGSVASPTH
jgi:predicted enzyme related to lactoylglutathione lyase